MNHMYMLSTNYRSLLENDDENIEIEYNTSYLTLLQGDDDEYLTGYMYCILLILQSKIWNLRPLDSVLTFEKTLNVKPRK